jgi:nucleoside-diphosphate-sugar epimerase
MRRKRILITGSEGFIGRHFDARLGLENYVDRIDKVLGTTAQNFFSSPFHEPNYDLVIHCAAMVGGRAKIDGDPLAIAENLAIDSRSRASSISPALRPILWPIRISIASGSSVRMTST